MADVMFQSYKLYKSCINNNRDIIVRISLFQKYIMQKSEINIKICLYLFKTFLCLMTLDVL